MPEGNELFVPLADCPAITMPAQATAPVQSYAYWMAQVKVHQAAQLLRQAARMSDEPLKTRLLEAAASLPFPG